MNSTNAPYCIIPDIEAYATATGDERRRICRRIAAAVGDPLALRTILGIDPEEFDRFYPDMNKPELTTTEAIDSFIDTYGPATARREAATVQAEAPEAETVAEVAAETTTGVTAADADEGLVPLAPAEFDLNSISASPIIEDGPATGDDATASMLDSFLGGSPHQEAPAPKTSNPASAAISESLVKVMIKNGNYRKALEIITDLSLNNPKKSVYFADQIRFLKKLIINQSKTR